MPVGRGLGWAALVFTVLVWASYLVAARAAVTAAFTPVELGVLRFLPGALLFAPVLARRGLRPGGARWRDVLAVGGFGGVGFVLLLTGGLRFAPAADAGMFTPTMLPVFVALLGVALGSDAVPRGWRLLGLGLIVSGALAVGGWEALANTASGAWRGHLMFLAASLSWAIYTLAYRRSGLGPIESAAMMCFWAGAGFVVLALFNGVDFLRHGWGVFLFHLTLQGLFSGFLATITYFFAITRLGAQPAAAFAALVPGLAAALAWPVLGEALGWVKAGGLAVVTLGVLLASGALSRGPARPAPPPAGR